LETPSPVNQALPKPDQRSPPSLALPTARQQRLLDQAVLFRLAQSILVSFLANQPGYRSI
jgi:hypothetical protein